MPLLDARLLPDQANEIGWNRSLDTFCKIFKVETKSENSYIIMNKALISNNIDITDYILYAMRDVYVL